MKKSILFIALVAVTGSLFAQKKTTTSGTVNFDATTSLDKMTKAENKTVIVAMDVSTGSLAFEVPIKNFTFGNPKMQEHFNSAGWLDSEKYPTSTFKGNIANLATLNLTVDGNYEVNVEGDLTIHGVTKPVKTGGKITVKGSTVKINSEFPIKIADYNIDGPQVGAGKVSKEPIITVSAELQ